MSEESYIQPGKAIMGFISGLLFGLVFPYYLYSTILPKYSTLPINVSPAMLNMILTFGVISAIASFFKVLWKPGTRPHGFFNVIFAGFTAYYMYWLFAGGLGSTEFGIFSMALGTFGFSINLVFMAIVIILGGIITIILYLYEMVA